MIRLVALLGSMATFGNAISVTAQQRANHTFFTAVPGFLPAVAPNAAPRQNLTLASAEIVCKAIDACIGFSFRSPTAMPSGVVDVSFKAVYEYCGYSRFPDGICPEENGEDWQVRVYTSPKTIVLSVSFRHCDQDPHNCACKFGRSCCIVTCILKLCWCLRSSV